MSSMRNIVLVVAFVVAILLPEVSYAQLDAASIARQQRQGQGMGQGIGMNQGLPGMDNGMDIEGREGEDAEAADSTDTRKRRPRRALESYYFTDTVRALNNWKWHVDRDYNRVYVEPLDTTLDNWRIDYVF